MMSFIYLTVIISLVTASETDWTKHCSTCTCIWVSGKKTANCSHQDFSEIPRDMSSEIRDIDFSNNPLHTLSDKEFIVSQLTDTHKLKLQNCSIDIVNEGAFLGLKLLIELDLSRNNFKSLKKDTFRELVKIRMITLSYNKLDILEDGLFQNLTYLRRLLLDHNEIESINENTFQDLPILNDLNLGYNKLKTVDYDITKTLPNLNSLNIEGNPWVCDCHLEAFRTLVKKKNLITQITECWEPARLKGSSWLETVTFACSPMIVEPSASTHIQATSNNITLTCKVSGDPEPDVDWTNNGHIVERDPRKSKQKYLTSKNKNGQYTWNNLTITNLNYKDRGEYRCVAKNPGGEDEKNVTLIIDNDVILGTSGIGNSTGLIIGLSIGLIILLIIILVLVCLFCRKTNRNGFPSKRRDLGSSSNECISMGDHSEFKKGLITEVNPICKPPRTTVPESVIGGGTEVSDVKKNLLDNESVFEGDDESRSLDFDQPLLRKSHNTLLDSEYRLNNYPFPPDLLPILPNAPQLSPAGSNASTLVIDSRLPPPHGPQSPIHSPIYDHAIYRTLPHSRSHSPFVAGVTMPRIPRQGAGYVTIPRKPRQQSWSSEPPPTLEGIGEPLYDNLGVRTTATGSSVLSLNKIGTEPAASTPRANRLFPLSPIDPIAESHEASAHNVGPHDLEKAPMYQQQPQPYTPENPPPRPLPKPRPNSKPQTPPKIVSSQTLPRNMNSNKLTPSRTQWAMDNAEQLRSPSEKRNSIAGDTPLTEAKPKKIPPRPPPKPKKRASTGPLFEDEGEDGTEV